MPGCGEVVDSIIKEFKKEINLEKKDMVEAGETPSALGSPDGRNGRAHSIDGGPNSQSR